MVRLYKKLFEYNIEMYTEVHNAHDGYDLLVYFTFIKDGDTMECPVSWDLLRLEPKRSIDILIKKLDDFAMFGHNA